MQKVGFAIYGRPTRLEYYPNGLIDELNIGRMFYFDGLSGDILLNKNESAIVVTQIQSGDDSTPVWIVAYFEYAESYGSNRAGGFLGAAVAFIDFPHPHLLRTTLFEIINHSHSLIDAQSRTFLKADSSQWNLKLPTPDPAFCIAPPFQSIRNREILRERVICEIGGDYATQLSGLVEAIILNPSFNNIETIILTNSDQFKSRATKSGMRAISTHQLFNFNSLLSTQHSNFIKLDKENRRQSELLAESRERLSTVEKQTSNEALRLNNLNQEISSLQTRREDLNKQFNASIEEFEGLKSRIQEHKILEESLKNKSWSTAKSHFGNEIRIEATETAELMRSQIEDSIKRQQKEYLDKLEISNESLKTESKRSSLISILLGSVLILLLLGIAFVKIDPFKIFVENTKKENLKDKEPVVTATISRLPEDCEFSGLPCNVGVWDYYLNLLDNTKSPEDFETALLHDWNFSELVDPSSLQNLDIAIGEKHNLDEEYPSIAQLNNILHQNNIDWKFGSNEIPDLKGQEKISESLFQNRFLIPIPSATEIDSLSIEGNIELEAVLSDYLASTLNIYTELNDSIDLKSNLVLEHFRWLVLVNNEAIIPSEGPVKLPFLK